MESGSKNGTNEVGYAKPPQNFRFKKGRSGNPRGLPKGALNMATAHPDIAQEVIIEENGKRKKVSKLEAAIAQLVSRQRSEMLRLGTCANSSNHPKRGPSSSPWRSS
jgi:Family of unknown function (DUF5681)